VTDGVTFVIIKQSRTFPDCRNRFNLRVNVYEENNILESDWQQAPCSNSDNSLRFVFCPRHVTTRSPTLINQALVIYLSQNHFRIKVYFEYKRDNVDLTRFFRTLVALVARATVAIRKFFIFFIFLSLLYYTSKI